MIPETLRRAVRLSEMRSYQIAHEADVSPSTLSRIINGIDLVKPGDPRVERIAKVLGVNTEDLFPLDQAGRNK